MAAREFARIITQRQKAKWLWSIRHPVKGSIADLYLREVRSITCALPPTLGFLPERASYPPALIAAFGIAKEREPGTLFFEESAVQGVHLTRLRPDGCGKAAEPAKIMVGPSKGSAIVLAPINDMLGLIISEGIEEALSVHQSTGLGAWAAGCASRLPALADLVPDWSDNITIIMDNDDDGRTNSTALADRLKRRGLHASLCSFG